MTTTRRDFVAGLAAGSALLMTSAGRALAQNKPLRIAYVVPGTLGDKGFLDSGNVGIERAKAELGAETRVLQASPQDPQEWKRNLQAVSDGSYDIVVSGGSGPIVDAVTEVATANPNQSYVFFAGDIVAPNVASIGFLYHEGSYLAGVLAAHVSRDTASFPLSRGNKTIGVVAGLDIPPINAFIAGFKQGALSVDPTINVLRTYAGTFADPNKGFAQTQALYTQGADIVYAVAGGTGLGVLRASDSENLYSIGVDTDQNGLFPGHVLASMVLDIGETLIRSFNDFSAGRLAVGKTVRFGVKQNGVRLIVAEDSVPQSVRDAISAARESIASGAVIVDSVLS